MKQQVKQYAMHDFLGIPRDQKLSKKDLDIVNIISKVKITKGKYNAWLDLPNGKKKLVTQKRIDDARVVLGLCKNE